MRQRSLNTLFIFCLTWMMSLSTPSLHAFLASGKAAGMALTGAAYPQDALAGAFNPAGIVDVCDRVDLGVSWDHYTGKSILEGNDHPIFGTALNGSYPGTHKRDFFTPDFGINKGFCLCDNWEVAVGLVVYNRDFAKTTYKHPIALIGTSAPGLEFIREEVSAVFAARFCERYSLGLSVNFIGQRFKAEGLQNFAVPVPIPPFPVPFSSNPDSVTNRGYDYSRSVGVTIGGKAQITDTLAFGIAYSPKVHMPRFHKYSGLLAQGGRLDVPANLLAGIAWNWFPCSTLAFDVNYIDWSRVRSLHNGIDTLTTAQLGTEDGAGFGWKGQVIYRLGVDYQLNDCWTVRAGYRYGNSPIRPHQTAINLLTLETVEQYLTLGATWAFLDCAELTWYYAHGFHNQIDGRDSVNLFLGGGDVNLREVRDVVGLSIGFNY